MADETTRDAAPESADNSLGQTTWVFPSFWAGGMLLLITASWALWFPGRQPAMPLVPLISVFTMNWEPLGMIAGIVSFLLVVSLVSVIAFPNRRWCWWPVGMLLLVSFVLDQHRLQPWAYQTAIYALVFATMSPSSARRWLRPLAAGVYLYSAAGKFDFQFTHTVGQDFLNGATRWIGGLPQGLGEETRVRLAFAFPVIEFSAGLGLLIPKTRRAAAIVIIAMHVCLLAILGPWNRDHSWGVLIWNSMLLGQAYLLFLRRDEPEGNDQQVLQRENDVAREPRVGPVAWMVRFVVVIALAAPLLERRGFWDHWTSWSLYSPHTSHVDLEIHQTAVAGMPRDVVAALRDDDNGDGWRLLDLGRWSLESRGVPIYPQARYQLGLAIATASREGLTEEVRARWSSVSDRRTGKRQRRMMNRLPELKSFAKRYWLLPSHPNQDAPTR